MAHVFVGPHVEVLGHGAPLGIGQVVPDLDLSDPHNQILVAKGWLVEHDAPTPTPPKPVRARAHPTEESE